MAAKEVKSIQKCNYFIMNITNLSALLYSNKMLSAFLGPCQSLLCRTIKLNLIFNLSTIRLQTTKKCESKFIKQAIEDLRYNRKNDMIN